MPTTKYKGYEIVSNQGLHIVKTKADEHEQFDSIVTAMNYIDGLPVKA